MMSRLSALVNGLRSVLDEAWDSVSRGALGSTLWLYSQYHSIAVFDGLIVAIKWVVIMVVVVAIKWVVIIVVVVAIKQVVIMQ